MTERLPQVYLIASLYPYIHPQAVGVEKYLNNLTATKDLLTHYVVHSRLVVGAYSYLANYHSCDSTTLTLSVVATIADVAFTIKRKVSLVLIATTPIPTKGIGSLLEEIRVCELIATTVPLYSIATVTLLLLPA